MAEKDLESRSIATDRAGQVTISVKDEEPATPRSTPNPSNAALHCLAILCLLLVVGLMLLLKAKSRRKKTSPYKTDDGFFVDMSLVAFVVAELTYAILIINYDLRGSIVYPILKSVCFFSGILAPLSLVLVLCVPRNLKWVRYLSICVLFVTVVACNFIGCLKLANKKDVSPNLEDHHQVIKKRGSNDCP